MTYANSEIPVLVECFKTSVNPSNADALKQAENTLKEHSRHPGYVLRTLEIVGLSNVDEPARLAAAVNFKNSVRTSWVVHEGETPPVIIQDNEREDIKRHLFTIVISAPANIRKQLNEALGIIAKSDFHERWPGLLPELVANLDKPGTQIAVFEAMAAVFKPLREVTIDDCDETMDYCQKGAAAKVLEVVQSMEGVAASAGNDREALTAVCTVVRLACDVLFSLNVHGLSLHMAELAESWMKIWKLWLEFHNDVLKEADSERESAEDAMKAQVVKCCHQFLEMQEEDIQPYLPTFVKSIWGLLVACTSSSGQDNLALSAIAFLTTVGRSTHHNLFATGDTIRQICEGIVIPNVSFREDDEEAFEGNYVEYLRKDLEGSDTDTRRRAACDFIRTLVDRFPAETTEIVNSYITQLLAKHLINPAQDWPMKDCAMHMVMALAVKGKTAAAGATSLNTLVDIEQFFEEHVLPELSTEDVNERPVLKADGLRYTYLFRSRLPKQKLLAAFPTIMRLLQSDSNVVHSYAAIVIERLLALRVPSAPAVAGAAAGAPPVAVAGKDMQPLLVPADVSSHLQQLLELLFAALRKEDSTENEYVMRALMRVIVFVGAQIVPVAQLCLDLMTAKLLEVCKNPRFAGFNHCLFDAVAALICATASDPPTLKALEDKLFPCFDHVLQAEVEEFQPYVFQVFALLIVKSQQLQRAYVDTMLKPFLQHHYWGRHGNIPALVILMQAYLQKAPQDIVEKQFVQPILGIFQMLLGLSRHYGDATSLLTSILAFLPMQAVSPLLPQVFTLLFGVLTSRRSPKTTVGFITCVARMICMHGAEPILGAMEASQGGSSRAVFTEVIPNNLDKVPGGDDKRVVSIALTRALCEHDAFLADSGMWVKTMETLVQFLSEDTNIALAEDLSESMAGMLEYTNEFSQLSNARMPPPPCMPEVKDVMPFLAQSLSQLSQRRPGTLGPLLSGQSAPLEQLRNYLTSSGVPIS